MTKKTKTKEIVEPIKEVNPRKYYRVEKQQFGWALIELHKGKETAIYESDSASVIRYFNKLIVNQERD